MKNKIPDMKTAFSQFTPEALHQKGAEMVATAKDKFKGPLFGKVDEAFNDDKSVAAELFQWMTNDGNWYRKWATPAIKNLRKKAQAGKYNSTQAIKLWVRAAEAGGDMYAKTYGGTGAKGKEMFTPGIIKMVSSELETTYKEEVEYESK
jgi:hypothetical protein